MARLTIEDIHFKFPNWEVSFTRNGDCHGNTWGKRRYHLKHKPTGKVNACILGNRLQTVLNLICNVEENPDYYLNCRSYFVAEN